MTTTESKVLKFKAKSRPLSSKDLTKRIEKLKQEIDTHLDAAEKLSTRGVLSQIILPDEHTVEWHMQIVEEKFQDLRNLNKLLASSSQEASRGLATPNDMYKAAQETRTNVKWRNIDSEHREKVKELLKSTAPEILQKIEDVNNPDEIIAKFIGIKLEPHERRVLRVLRAIVSQRHNSGEIKEYGSKVTIKAADFYKLYGLKSKPEGGYEHKQTKPLRDLLLSAKTNLTEKILFNNRKCQTVVVTSFVHRVEWQPKATFFGIALEELLFIKNEESSKSYYYEQTQGLNNLLELMPNSKAALKLHDYLEYSLRSNQQEFNATALLEQSGLITAYNSKHPARAIKDLEKILDNMVKANDLIKDWGKLESFSDDKGKYVLTSLYHSDKVLKFPDKRGNAVKK